jgi:hypothetical protein
MRRRAFLTVGSLALLPGCGALRGLDAAAADAPGSVAIRNDDDRDHRVTVTVERVSDDADDVPPPNSDRTPEAGGTRYREVTFEVPAGETVRETEVVTETGAYFVTVELGTGARATTWLGLYEDVAGGVAEEKLEVYVGGDGDVTAVAPSAE